MTDTTDTAQAVQTAVDASLNASQIAVNAALQSAVAEQNKAVDTVATTARKWKLELHEDWEWIVAHAWSSRFIFVAFVLSCLEVFLPLLADKTPLPPVFFGGVVALVTGAAFVSRLVAQKREGVSDDA